MLLASPTEGGPIVLLEAWAVRVPFFMRRTGIAAEYPDNVFIVEEDESALSVAKRVVATVDGIQSAAVQSVLDGGWRTLSELRGEMSLCSLDVLHEGPHPHTHFPLLQGGEHARVAEVVSLRKQLLGL